MRIPTLAYAHLVQRDVQPICAQAIAVDAAYNLYAVEVGCSVDDPYQKLDNVLRQCDAQSAPYPTTPSENWPIIFAGTQLTIAAAASTSAAFVTCLQDSDRGDNGPADALHDLLLLTMVPAAACVVWGAIRGVRACWPGRSSGAHTAPQMPAASTRPMAPDMGVIELDDLSVAPPPPAYYAGSDAAGSATKSAARCVPDVGSAS